MDDLRAPLALGLRLLGDGALHVRRQVDVLDLDGALWRARAWAVEDEPPLHTGEAIVVEGVDGLTLTVRRAEEWELTP